MTWVLHGGDFGMGGGGTGSLLFRVPNPMALCQNHCALRNGSFASLQASLSKGIHLIQIAGHAGFETIFRVWPLLI